MANLAREKWLGKYHVHVHLFNVGPVGFALC